MQVLELACWLVYNPGTKARKASFVLYITSINAFPYTRKKRSNAFTQMSDFLFATKTNTTIGKKNFFWFKDSLKAKWGIWDGLQVKLTNQSLNPDNIKLIFR